MARGRWRLGIKQEQRQMAIYNWLEEKLLHEISWEGMGTVKWGWLGMLVCTVIC